VLVDGIFSLAAALRSRGGRRPSWNRVVHGIAGIGAGILMFFIPRITALILVYLIAVWSLITGFLQIAAAVRLRRVIPGEGWMILAGLVSVGFGMLLAFLPAPEGTALVFWIAAFALVLGAMLVALAFRLRRHGQELPV
jgi:uncharacterized membrane protein HdeD (DUF308 family)